MHNLGADVGKSDFGTHSCRKGAGTYCLGQVAGPNPITVTLRMGHSLGKIRDKYIFHCEGGDQLCGRMVNGSDFTSEMFAILPPHFLPAANAILTEDFWTDMLPGYKEKPSGFRATLPFLLASLIHHEDFLRRELPPNNPIFRSRVFTQNESLAALRPLIKLGVGRCPYTGMQATGIPPHLAISGKIEELMKKIEKIEDVLKAQNVYMKEVLPSKVSDHVVDDIRQNFQVTGVMPVTLKDIQGLLADVKIAMDNQYTMMTEFVEKKLEEQAASQSNRAHSRTSVNGQWNWAEYQWSADNNVHMVPEGWRLPVQVPVKAAYDWWYHGDKATSIRPYCNLTKNDILSCDSMRHTRLKRVLSELAQRMELPEDVSSPMELSLTDSDSCFFTAFESLKSDITEHTRIKRPNDWSYGSAYNAIVKVAKKTKLN
jgi:hypothetical protein